MAASPGFIFGGNTGETAASVKRKRAIAEALFRDTASDQPKDLGTGLAAIGKALLARSAMSRADAAETEMGGRQKRIGAALFGAMGDNSFGGSALAYDPAGAAASGAVASSTAGSGGAVPAGAENLRGGIVETANALGIDPLDLGTAISYETAGTFDPTKAGPTTQWGQHKGLIQFGEPQAAKYGVDWNNPAGSQLGADGAIAKYLRDAGVQPGMGMMDIYSAINAGRVGRYDASDANNGGAPGTVADKVNKQMGEHRAKAQALLGSQEPVRVASIDPGFMPSSPRSMRALSIEDPTIALPGGQTIAREDYNAAVRPNLNDDIGRGASVMLRGGSNVRPPQPSDFQASASAAASPANETPLKDRAVAAALAPLPPPQTVEPNPVPPQSKFSPAVMAALEADPGFDGFAQSAGTTTPALPGARLSDPDSLPVAPGANGGMNLTVMMQIAADPDATDEQRAVATSMVNRALGRQDKLEDRAYEANNPDAVLNRRFKQAQIDALGAKQPNTTDDIREFQFAQQGGYGGSFAEWQLAQKKAGASTTTIGTGENTSEFVKKSDEAAAKRLGDIVEAGNAAPEFMGSIQQLADLGKAIGTGKGAQITAALGPYAQMVGIDLAGLDESQAFNSIVAKIAPQMRPAGSGATSDFDAAQFLRSLPSLGNTPGGNEIIAGTFRAVGENKLAAAEIAQRAQSGEIKWQDAEREIRALPSPYERFKAFRDQPPGAAASSPQASPPAAVPSSNGSGFRQGRPGGGQVQAAPQRARNPQTGQVIEFRNGQWVPVQ